MQRKPIHFHIGLYSGPVPELLKCKLKLYWCNPLTLGEIRGHERSTVGGFTHQVSPAIVSLRNTWMVFRDIIILEITPAYLP